MLDVFDETPVTNVQVFNNEQFGSIRTTGTADEPLFCAADICKALGYSNGRDAVAKHCDEGDVAKCDTPTQSGTQLMTYVNESGLYSLIFGSKLEQAKCFKHWVTKDILPAIRKTGSYSIQNMSRKELALMIVQAEEEKEALMLENKQKEAQLQEQKPKVVFADAILGSTSSCLVGELAKILTQNGYKIGQNQLFIWLRANHYLGVSGEYYNIPNQRYVEQGLFELKKNTHSENGVMKTTVTTKVTPKGQQYFINKFIAK